VCFRDNRWLELFPLNKETVLDYFALSGFYDRQCNNEIVKMQRLDMDKMKQLKGTEFVLFSHQEPVLYVIRKQRRETPTLAIPQSTYYVINGTIFQSPNVYSVLSSRMLKVIYHMQQAFRIASGYKTFDLNTGYVWDFTKSEGESKPVVPKPKDTKQIEDAQRVDKIIASLYAQFAPPKPTPSPAPTQPGTRAPNTPVAVPSPSFPAAAANANSNSTPTTKRKQDVAITEISKKQKTV